MKSNITYCDCCGSVVKSYYYSVSFQPRHTELDEDFDAERILMKLSGEEDEESSSDICEKCYKVMMHFLNLRAEEVRPLHDLIKYLEDGNVEEGEVNG